MKSLISGSEVIAKWTDFVMNAASVLKLVILQRKRQRYCANNAIWRKWLKMIRHPPDGYAKIGDITPVRILLVEDDLDIQKMLVSYLKTACFAVDATASGEEGSYFARTNEYDLVILDYMLPEKNGLEICKEIRERGKTMPILMLSI